MGRMTRHSAARGMSTIESAITLPIVILVTFGLIEYGWLFLTSQMTTNAAREGVREAVLPGATNATVLAQIDDYMGRGWLAGFTGLTLGSGYTVDILDSTDAAVDVTTVTTGETLRISVNVTYADIALLGGMPLIPVPATITGTMTMAKEGA